MQHFTNIDDDQADLNNCLTMLSKSQLKLINKHIHRKIGDEFIANIHLKRPHGINFRTSFPLSVKPEILKKAMGKLVELNRNRDPKIQMFGLLYSLTIDEPYIVVSYTDSEDVKVFI